MQSSMHYEILRAIVSQHYKESPHICLDRVEFEKCEEGIWQSEQSHSNQNEIKWRSVRYFISWEGSYGLDCQYDCITYKERSVGKFLPKHENVESCEPENYKVGSNPHKFELTSQLLDYISHPKGNNVNNMRCCEKDSTYHKCRVFIEHEHHISYQRQYQPSFDQFRDKVLSGRVFVMDVKDHEHDGERFQHLQNAYLEALTYYLEQDHHQNTEVEERVWFQTASFAHPLV